MKRLVVVAALVAVLTGFVCRVWQEYFVEGLAELTRGRPRRSDEPQIDPRILAPGPARHPVVSSLLAAALTFGIGWTIVRGRYLDAVRVRR